MELNKMEWHGEIGENSLEWLVCCVGVGQCGGK